MASKNYTNFVCPTNNFGDTVHIWIHRGICVTTNNVNNFSFMQEKCRSTFKGYRIKMRQQEKFRRLFGQHIFHTFRVTYYTAFILSVEKLDFSHTIHSSVIQLLFITIFYDFILKYL